MKTCIGCREKLSFNNFYIKKDRENQYSSRCKKCHHLFQKEYSKEYNKKYYIETEKEKRKTSEYKEKNSLYLKKYRQSDSYKKSLKKYREKESYKKYTREYMSLKRKTNIHFAISARLRGRVRDAIRNNKKNGSAVKDLGCTLGELKNYIEERFDKKMNWDIFLTGQIHIDHIIPLVSFDLTDRVQFLKACHYTNLQPLWAVDNIKKGAKHTP